MTGRREGRVFPRREQGGIPGAVLGVTGGETPFKGLVKGRVQRRFAWLFNTGPALYPWCRWRRHVRPMYWAAALYQPQCGHRACVITCNPHTRFRNEGQLLCAFYREENRGWDMERFVSMVKWLVSKWS